MPHAPDALDRPLGTCERLYWLLGKASPTGFAFRTRLDRPLQVDDLRRGFARVCPRHPTLRSTIVVEDGTVRFRPARGEVTLPVQRLDDDDDLVAELDRQLDTPFADGDCPPLRVLWWDRPGGAPELLWVFDHASTDAGSAARVCLEILAAAVEVSEPGAPMAPAPPQEALYPANRGGWLARLRWILRTVAERIVGRLTRRSPPALPGARSDGGPTRELRSTELRVDRAATAALRERARAQGTTVHGAICGATLLATAAQVEPGGTVRWPMASAVDLRPRLEPPLATEQLANVISMVATPTDVAADSELWALARAVRDQLRERLERGDAHALWAAFPPDWMLPPAQATAQRLVKAMSRRAMPLIVTNIGALDHPSAPVRELSFAMAPQPNCALVLAAVSWRGELRLWASFNQVRIGRDASQALADGIRTHLISG